jgi:integrase/recombinase XerD
LLNDGRLVPLHLGCAGLRELSDLGIPRTAHSLRHRFATEYARLDPDLRNLQTIMGHSDISTTTIFVQVEPEACANGVVALAKRTRQRRQRA